MSNLRIENSQIYLGFHCTAGVADAGKRRQAFSAEAAVHAGAALSHAELDGIQRAVLG